MEIILQNSTFKTNEGYEGTYKTWIEADGYMYNKNNWSVYYNTDNQICSIYTNNFIDQGNLEQYLRFAPLYIRVSVNGVSELQTLPNYTFMLVRSGGVPVYHEGQISVPSVVSVDGRTYGIKEVFTNPAVGWIFTNQEMALQYIRGEVGPSQSINFYSVEYDCYWTGNKETGYNLKIVWQSQGIEQTLANNWSILIGSALKYTNGLGKTEIMSDELFTSIAYDTPAFMITSKQIEEICSSRLKSILDISINNILTIYASDGERNTEMCGISFEGKPGDLPSNQGKILYEIVTDNRGSISNEYKPDNTLVDGSYINFRNSAGEM